MSLLLLVLVLLVRGAAGAAGAGDDDAGSGRGGVDSDCMTFWARLLVLGSGGIGAAGDDGAGAGGGGRGGVDSDCIRLFLFNIFTTAILLSTMVSRCGSSSWGGVGGGERGGSLSVMMGLQALACCIFPAGFVIDANAAWLSTCLATVCGGDGGGAFALERSSLTRATMKKLKGRCKKAACFFFSGQATDLASFFPPLSVHEV